MVASPIDSVPGKLGGFPCFAARSAILLAAALLPCAATLAQPTLAVPEPAALNAVLDRQVAGGYLPFVYARLEDRDGGVIYEHAAVKRELLPKARIDGRTWIRIWSGPDVPGYAPESALHLGGEGMLATADGYADFLRMLLRHGALGERRFLERGSVETLYAPHTLTDSPHGHNGFNLRVSGQAMRDAGDGDAGLWIGGGYEGTHFWVDPKREFVAVVLTQVFRPPAGGAGWLSAFRGEIYRQLRGASSGSQNG